MAEKILVTAGNVGNAVVSGLIRKGIPVRVAVRQKKENPEWDKADVQQVVFDFDKPDTMKRAFDGIEKYFSVSPVIDKFVETGISVVETAKKTGVKYIVRASVKGADDKAITFGRWHRAVEKAIESSGMNYTILQPTTFMQNHLNYAASIKSQGTFSAPVGNGKTSFVDTRDLSAAVVEVLTTTGHEGKKYVITGSEVLSETEIAHIFSDVLGRQVKYAAVSDDDSRKAMLNTGMPKWLVDSLMELNNVTKDGYLAGVSPDLEHLLNRKPTLFRQFVQDYRSVFV